jgi:NADPH2:quinone reductase
MMGNFMAGAFQEYVLVDARYASIVPKNISDADASNFPVNGFTSAACLFSTEGGINAGLGIPFPGTPESKSFDYKSAKILIIGGGSGCGKFGIQLAKIAGIGTIITTASIAGEAELKSLGATHVVDRKAPDMEEQLRKLVGDDLIYVYDTITNTFDHSLTVSLLSNTKKGTLIHLIPGKVSEEVAGSKKAGFEERQMQGTTGMHPNLAALYLKKLTGWIESGELKVPKYQVIEGLDVDQINKVLDGYKEGKGDKWVVVI